MEDHKFDVSAHDFQMPKQSREIDSLRSLSNYCIQENVLRQQHEQQQQQIERSIDMCVTHCYELTTVH